MNRLEKVARARELQGQIDKAKAAGTPFGHLVPEVTKLLDEVDAERNGGRIATLERLDPNTPPSPYDVSMNKRHQVGEIIYSEEYAQAFHRYIRSGGKVVEALLDEALQEHQALSFGSDTAGGYLLPGQTQDEILARLPAESEIIGLMRPVQATQNEVKWPRVQAHGSSASIYTSAGVGSMVDEVPGATEGENNPTFGLHTIQLGKARYMARVGMDLADDYPSLLDFLVEDASINLALLAEQQAIAGDGIGPNLVGLTTLPSAASPTENEVGTVDVEGSTANTISNTNAAPGSAPKVLDLLYAVPGQYRRRAGFRVVFRSAIELELRKLVDGNDRFMWSADGGFGSPTNGLAGFPKAISEFVPDDGTDGNKVLIAGDWSQAIFAARGGIRVQVANERYADTDQIGLFVRSRFGIGFPNVDAFRIGVV